MKQQNNGGIWVPGRAIKDTHAVRLDLVDRCNRDKRLRCEFRTPFCLARTNLTHVFSFLGDSSARAAKRFCMRATDSGRMSNTLTGIGLDFVLLSSFKRG